MGYHSITNKNDYGHLANNNNKRNMHCFLKVLWLLRHDHA